MDVGSAEALLAAEGTPAGTLAQIAAEHPSLWGRILSHPHIYPDLSSWILARQPALASAVPVAQPQGSSGTPRAESPAVPAPRPVAVPEPASPVAPEARPAPVPEPLPVPSPPEVPAPDVAPAAAQAPAAASPAPAKAERKRARQKKSAPVAAQESTAPTPAGSSGRLRSTAAAFGTGLLIGVLAGGALGAALVLWVLPGLFGSVLG